MDTNSFPARHADSVVCRLVTTGRRSGRPHDIEIWFGVGGDTMYFISGNGPGADWYRNALHTPRVTVRLGGEERHGLARSVGPGRERELAGRIMTAKYGGWGGDPDIGLTEHDWTWNVPVLAVEDWVSERSVPTAPR